MTDAMEKHFPEGVKWTKPQGGLFLWVTTPESIDTIDLFKEAVKHKVAFVPGTSFFPHGDGHNTMRLNFSNAQPEQITEGIKRLGDDPQRGAALSTRCACSQGLSHSLRWCMLSANLRADATGGPDGRRAEVHPFRAGEQVDPRMDGHLGAPRHRARGDNGRGEHLRGAVRRDDRVGLDPRGGDLDGHLEGRCCAAAPSSRTTWSRRSPPPGESLAAGIIFTIPALVLTGVWTEFKFWPTTLIAMCGGLLGRPLHDPAAAHPDS